MSDEHNLGVLDQCRVTLRESCARLLAPDGGFDKGLWALFDKWATAVDARSAVDGLLDLNRRLAHLHNAVEDAQACVYTLLGHKYERMVPRCGPDGPETPE